MRFRFPDIFLKFSNGVTIHLMPDNFRKMRGQCVSMCCAMLFGMLLLCQPQAWATVLYGETIAVMPFDNFSETLDVSEPVSRLFARQLTEWSGAFVYHPQLVSSTIKSDDRFREDMPAQKKALLLGDILGASVVIYGAVTEYDGFSPYALGIAIEVVRVDTGEKVLAKNFSFKGFALWPDKTKKSLLPRTMQAYVEYVIGDLIKSYF